MSRTPDAFIKPPKRDITANLVYTHTSSPTMSSGSGSSSRSRSIAPQRRHKRELSDSSVEIIEIRSVQKRPRTEERPAPPPRREEQRLQDFQFTPPHRFGRIYQRATTESFSVLSRERYDEGDCPQERFELAGTTGNVYKIWIGREPWCDCPHALKGNQCKHLVYILHRVLKAPYDILYQFALLSSELRQIYDKLSRPSDDDAKNLRKAVEGECAICYNDFESDEDTTQSSTVVWCRAKCGQNLHKTCFDRWARSCSGRVTCPLCRSIWEKADEVADEHDDVAAAVDTSLGVEGEDGYINVADQLGISEERDWREMHGGTDVGIIIK